MREDSVADAKAIEGYLSQVHEMATELHQRQDATSSTPVQKRPKMTTLSTAARRGNMKIEVHTLEVCCVGEIVVIGGKRQRQLSRKRVWRFTSR